MTGDPGEIDRASAGPEQPPSRPSPMPAYWISPVASFGPGLLDQDGTELVLNASYGVNVQLWRIRSGGGDPLNLYVAHQGLDLFESNRLILGLSLER